MPSKLAQDASSKGCLSAYGYTLLLRKIPHEVLCVKTLLLALEELISDILHFLSTQASALLEQQMRCHLAIIINCVDIKAHLYQFMQVN